MEASDLKNLRPTDDNVLVKLREAPKKVGRIILPDVAKDKKQQVADVIAVGPGKWYLHENGNCKRAPMQVSPKDVVICGPYAGAAVVIDGTPYRLIHEDQILMIIDDPDLVKVPA
jgi:chaperonin GroES